MNRFFKGLLLINVLLTLTLGILYFSQKQEIAIVRTPEVLSRYNGMLEAEALLKEKENGYLSQLDTLRVLYNKEVESLNISKKKLNPKQVRGAEERIELRKQDYLRYQDVVDNRFKEDQEKITEGVLNQVNEYIKKYAEEHHLKIVIGSNITGNVLYGQPDIDITEDIINGLNEAYR
jgi:outer membrane protein